MGKIYELYQVDERIRSCVKIADGLSLDQETGEVLDVEALEALEMERSDKVDDIAGWLKNELAMVEMLKAEKKKMDERIRSHTALAEKLNGVLRDILFADDGFKKFEGKKCCIRSYMARPRVVVPADVNSLAPEYLRFKAPEANKDAIRDALNAGVSIPGCSLEPNRVLIVK